MTKQTIATNNGTYTIGDTYADVDVTGVFNTLQLTGDTDRLVVHGYGTHATMSGQNAYADLESQRGNVTVTGGGFIHLKEAVRYNQVTLRGDNQSVFLEEGGQYNQADLGMANGYAKVTGAFQSLTGSGHLVVDASGSYGSGIIKLTGEGAVAFGGHGSDKISFMSQSYVTGGDGADEFAFNRGTASSGFATVGDFNLLQGDTLNLHDMGIDYRTMGQQVSVVGDSLVIHPDPSNQSADHSFVLAGVGNQLSAHGGVYAQIEQGHVII